MEPRELQVSQTTEVINLSGEELSKKKKKNYASCNNITIKKSLLELAGRRGCAGKPEPGWFSASKQCVQSGNCQRPKSRPAVCDLAGVVLRRHPSHSTAALEEQKEERYLGNTEGMG